MHGNGLVTTQDDSVLRWSGPVLAAEHLRDHLNGHHDILVPLATVVTPLAFEELRDRGVRVLRDRVAQAGSSVWGYAEDRHYPLVRSACTALAREGIALQSLVEGEITELGAWAREAVAGIAKGSLHGGVLFCEDPGLVCCIANKVPGLRAVAVLTVHQAARATLTLAANLLVVEMPGRTFYEIRQILRILCNPTPLPCPEGLVRTLRELDGHAHR